MNVSQYFHSSYTIGTEGYKWGSSLDKVVPTYIENYLEDIDRYWIQHTDDYTMRNKQYKKEDHGGYAINVRAFDIAGALDNHRIMEDGNKSLHTMGLNTTFHEVDGYMDIEVKDDKTPNTDRTEVSTFMTETLPLANEKIRTSFPKIKTLSLQNYWNICKKSGVPSQGRRGENECPMKKGSSPDKWIVRKHGKIKRVLPYSNK